MKDYNDDKGFSMKYVETTQYYFFKKALQLRGCVKEIKSNDVKNTN